MSELECERGRQIGGGREEQMDKAVSREKDIIPGNTIGKTYASVNS